MTDKEAMKLALEALELLTDTEQTFGALDYGDNAITALKERLAQPEQEPVQELKDKPAPWHHRILKAHPFSEPSEWPDSLRLKYVMEELDQYRSAFTLSPAQPAQPEQEPVAWFSPSGNLYKTRFHATANGEQVVTPLYTTPPQREWVGLTDEEMKAVCAQTWSYDPYLIARAIEAKLKEKNGG
jgi:hypothetical protein